MRVRSFVLAVAVVSMLGACRARSCGRRAGDAPLHDAGKTKQTTSATSATSATESGDGGPKGVDRCRADDQTGVVLPTLPADLDAGPGEERPAEHAVRDSLDGLCGDVWCESDFEYWFRRYRCEASGDRCLMQMRMYRKSLESPEIDTAKREVSGEGFRARIVGRAAVKSCVPPCFTKAPTWEPCEVFDVECEVLPGPADPRGYIPRGQTQAYHCTSATLSLVEKRFPKAKQQRPVK